MQIEERKKEEDFLKSLDYEQARIWALDCKKYNDDEKEIVRRGEADPWDFEEEDLEEGDYYEDDD